MNTLRRRCARKAFLCSAAVAAIALAAPHGVLAGSAVLPTGGAVQSGQASIAAAGPGALVVSQSSKAAIIDWSSFSIGQGGSVQFNNGAGATLNRVLSGGPISNLDGRLSATGSVYLINPSGVIIGKDGVVKVGGTFAASTLDVDDAAFLNGGALTFSGQSKASVVNLGKVEALGGDVVLAAAVVKNAGSLRAPNGEVGLLAGYSVTIKDEADQNGLFTVQIGGAGTSVTNEGVIAAATAELRANGGNIYALAGDTSSVIKATEVSHQGGQIFLTAPGGSVSVASGVTLDASGTGAGSGGHILVDGGSTSFHGVALAKGGALGGDGGLIETSGGALDVSGAKVATTAAHGATGTWLLDPYDLTVNAAGAAAIEQGLANSNVTVQTSGSSASTAFGVANSNGSGDITIAAPISWSSGHTLTLDAWRSLHVDAPITVAGGGGVVIKTNDGGSGGDYDFGLTSTGFTGAISYTGGASSGASLTINGTPYTLLYSMSDVQNINGNLGGNFALATSLDASGTTYGQAVVGGYSSTFSGSFEGLGHTISNLTINDTTSPGYDGLFGQSNGTIRDIGLVGGSVGGGLGVGALVGMQNAGAITDAYATTAVVGETGGVSSLGVGGLVGMAAGTITNAYATGAVVGGEYVGGLIGMQTGGAISNVHATGAVTGSGGYVGGLGGYQQSGTISNAYATGAVRAGGDLAGGLIGLQSGGAISTVYATGTVTGVTTVGGLVGGQGGGTISNAYATGAVSGDVWVGGLVGGQSGGVISNAYATGAVVGGSQVGGLVGYSAGATVTNVYYDTQTTGQTSDAAGAVGLTTRQLQGLDPIAGGTHFSAASLGDSTGAVWGAGGGVLPYLKAFVVNTIAGTVYSDYGVTPLGGATVVEAFVSGGGAISTATSANATGVYSLVAPGSNGTVILFLDHAGRVADTVVSYTGSSLTGVNLYGGYLTFANVSASTLSGTLDQLAGFALPAGYGAGDFLFSVGGSTVTPTGGLAIDGASGFVFDHSLNLGADALEITASGAVTQAAGTSIQAGSLSGSAASLALTNAANTISSLGGFSTTGGGLMLASSGDLTVSGAVSAAGTLDLSTAGSLTLASGAGVSAASGDDVTLAAAGAFINQAGASAVNVSGGGRWLIYSSAPGADVFGGLNSNNTAVWSTASGASVSASGNRYVFAYQPTLTVTTTSDSKTYGTDATGQIQADYVITGFEPGVAGAFLGDAASAAYSGAPSLASAGAGASATVGSYAITASLGALTSASGYAFQFANTGQLTVAPPVVTLSVTNLPFPGANGGGANLFNGPTSSDSLGSAPLSGGYADPGGGGGGGGGPPGAGPAQGQGSPGGAPYPGNQTYSSDIRFGDGTQQ